MRFIRNLAFITLVLILSFIIPLSATGGDIDKKDEEKIEELLEKGNRYLDEGEVDRAYATFKDILEIDPDNALAHNNLGLVYKEKKLYFTAKEEFEKALELLPNYYKALNNLGSILYLQGKYEKAIEKFEKALRSKPNFSEAHWNIALCYEQLDDDINALKHWRQFIASAKDSPYIPLAQMHIDELLSIP
ncbi:MAG TPA: tetratricopeptide repeat protein [Firmicutes bacterium]|nr:MAG: hypothetical protein DRH51_03720 [Candidatus Coatesbacteria bacterium]RLC43510.1 MAG: hypothetical protein DRH49_01080 [Candidatus Coatesbacteria bacterium]RLC44838.1 MAG: hypothetical protein DRH44_01140 [Candidatus Coatesbacteria bacterium]HDM43064.1 tetratricopeptide repeat protein [Bacillota bacterium]